MKKIVWFILFILISCTTLAVYRLKDIDAVLTRASHKIIEVSDLNEVIAGVKIEQLDFNTAQVESLGSLSWSDVFCKVLVNKPIESAMGPQLNIWMEKVKIELKNFDEKKFNLIFNGLTIKKLNETEPSAQTNYPIQIEEGELKIEAIFDFLNTESIKDQLGDQVRELSSLLKNGQTIVPVYFSGITVFEINHHKVQARLLIRQDGAKYCLAVDENFFRKLSNLMDEKLTDSEIEVLSKNPFKVAKLMDIRNFVRKEVTQRHYLNKDIPEDAYRHVLWSFLLTREYGPGFAKIITDAHEKGDMDNTPAEHQMDYHNNAIGRQYASTDVSMHQVLHRVLHDPDVIRLAQ